MRGIWNNLLLSIKRGYAKEQKELPDIAKRKEIDSFMVEFIYNSNKIEGSKLSFKDTADLFVHGTTPKGKPLKDVREAEGHKNAFYAMLNFRGVLSLNKILSWHKMIFESSDPLIAGKLRLHRIMVTGSRVRFPYPEELHDLMKGFLSWYNKNKNKYNPVEFAALVHLKFVTIHPFSDGNGRISRLLANCVLNSYNYPLFNIKFGDRRLYYSNLEKSQLWNDEKHFVRFFVKKYVKVNKQYMQ